MSAYATQAATAGSASEPDNRLVWTRSAEPHYEVYYITFNHRASQTGFWIRYTLESPTHEPPYIELWFAAFDARDPAKNVAVRRRLSIADLEATAAPFSVRMGDAILRHDGAVGAIRGAGHDVSWDLAWLPAERSHRWLPDVIYRTSFADTRVLSPNLDVPIRGRVVVDGRETVLEGEPGGQTHIWGRKHAFTHAWAHVNAFDGRRGAALESITVRLKRGGIILPPLTLLTLYLDGEELRFTELSDTLLTRGRYSTCRYEFHARGKTVRLHGEFTCRPEDMILAEYVDPDGEKLFCQNTEVGDASVRVWRRSSRLGRWQEQTVLRAPRTAHFELTARTPDPAIAGRHLRV
jgi:hypothetical protein